MKYIIEMSYEFQDEYGADTYDVVHYSIETDLDALQIYRLITEKSSEIEKYYHSNKKIEKTENNIIFLKNKPKNYVYSNKQLQEMMQLCFDRGCIIVPLGLIYEEIVILTLDQWFEYCIKD